MSKQLRIGALGSLEDIKTAIRDLETAIQEVQGLAAMTQDGDPAAPEVLVRLADGTYEIWDIVSTGGCTITKDAANKRITIKVP